MMGPISLCKLEGGTYETHRCGMCLLSAAPKASMITRDQHRLVIEPPAFAFRFPGSRLACCRNWAAAAARYGCASSAWAFSVSRTL